MTRYIIAGCVVLVALLGLQTWRIDGIQKERDLAQERLAQVTVQNRQLQRTRRVEQSVQGKHSASNKLLKEQERKQDAQLTEAVRSNPVWADERVPDAVLDALGM